MIVNLHGRGGKYAGGTILEPFTAADFLQKLLIPQFLGNMKNLTILSIENDHEAAQNAYNTMKKGPGIGTSADTASATIRYRNDKRVEFEEKIACILEYMPVRDIYLWKPHLIVSVKRTKEILQIVCR